MKNAEKVWQRWKAGVSPYVPPAVLAREGFREAQPVPGKRNHFVFAGRFAPFKGDDLLMTMVVAFKPMRGVRIRPGASLVLGKNMDVFLYTTTYEATFDNAVTVAQLGADRWDVELGVKEHNQFLPTMPSGWTMRYKMMGIAMAMVAQAVAQYYLLVLNRRRRRAGLPEIEFLKDLGIDVTGLCYSNVTAWARGLVEAPPP